MLNPKKSLGQNFLLDNNLCKKIINLIDIKNKFIIEIGPGTGKITDQIIKKNPKKLIIIEKDKDLFKYLSNKYSHLINVLIINDDALNFNYTAYKRINIISNLPYNLSTKIIINLLTNCQNIDEMVFMIQKEVAEKISKDKIKNNKLSFYINTLSNFEKKFNIPKHLFYPKPKIESTIVKINPKKNLLDKQKLLDFSIKIFMHKRKKINNIINFKNFDINNKILLKRAEDLSNKELIMLFNNF